MIEREEREFGAKVIGNLEGKVNREFREIREFREFSVCPIPILLKLPTLPKLSRHCEELQPYTSLIPTGVPCNDVAIYHCLLALLIPSRSDMPINSGRSPRSDIDRTTSL